MNEDRQNPKAKRGRGRPARPMSEQIPDTPENVVFTLLDTPPKKPDEWDYLRPSFGMSGLACD